MMKGILTAIVVSAMAMALASCSGEQPDETPTGEKSAGKFEGSDAGPSTTGGAAAGAPETAASDQ